MFLSCILFETQVIFIAHLRANTKKEGISVRINVETSKWLFSNFNVRLARDYFFWVIIEGFIAVGGDSYLLKSFYCNERSAPEASKLDGANKCHKTI